MNQVTIGSGATGAYNASYGMLVTYLFLSVKELKHVIDLK